MSTPMNLCGAGGPLRAPLRAVLLVVVVVVFVVVVGGMLAPRARADGDPGSDVLVSQSLFFASDAGIDIAQETQLDDLLSRARRNGLPVRVAIIAHPDDLGAIGALWHKPQSYAQFLGIELNLAFKGPLLVVMPDGVGLRWPGHDAVVASAERQLAGTSVSAGSTGLVAASTRGVERLAAASGVRLSSRSSPIGPAATASGSVGAAGAAAGAAAGGAQGGPAIASTSPSGPTSALAIGAIIAALVAVAAAVRIAARRGFWAIPGLALAVAAAVVVLVAVDAHTSSSAQANLANNPNLDPGTTLPGPQAPNFTLYDQFGKPMTLRQYRGKVVILAFTDSECTTICPLTTTAMLDAKRLLGVAGKQVELLGVDANAKDTQIEDVLSYSQLHGMTHAWRFGTSAIGQLDRVWKDYNVEADIENGLISHTPALFVIDPQGRERKLYVTQQSYTAVPQLGQLLAQEASALLPGHPAVASHVPYGKLPTIPPTVSAELPRSGGGTVRIGPGASHLYVFFDTWDQEVMPIGGDLDGLDGYARRAGRSGLPGVIGVDEGSVEPAASALPSFLHGLASPLAYPVAIDNSGRLADGYQVQGEPWLVLISARGKILWYEQPDTDGWLTTGRLAAQVHAALKRGPAPPANAAVAQRELSGSPAVLTDLHEQASRLLGGEPALAARIRALRGFPIVLNIWASWCEPCRAEFNLFANASAHYGRSIAFLGADYNDSPGNAEAFLGQHPISYPSYQITTGQLHSLLPGGIEGTPTTLYITATGHVDLIHSGQYESQGALDGDIESFGTAGR